MERINDLRQLRIDQDTRRANAKRYSHNYIFGEKVLKKRYIFKKLDQRWDGPYEITQVHVNGTVTIQLKQNVTERINIRRIKPYKNPTPTLLV